MGKALGMAKCMELGELGMAPSQVLRMELNTALGKTRSLELDMAAVVVAIPTKYSKHLRMQEVARYNVHTQA